MAGSLSSDQPTSVDVARKAGVSQAAVSLVFAGKATGRVSKRTQEAIVSAAQELGYQPHRVAQMLRSGRSNVIVLVIPDIQNPYFAALLEGVEKAARREGYSVVLLTIKGEDDWQEKVNETFASRAVEGWIICALSPLANQLQQMLKGKAILVEAFSENIPSLRLDIQGGINAALEHLLALGHRHIAHLAAAVDEETFHIRHRVYLETLEQAHVPIHKTYQVSAPFKIDAAQAAAEQLLQLPEPPTAILCDSDMLAVGVYKAAYQQGLSIPKDLSVTGFDNSLLAQAVEPELTTVAIPTNELGEQAVAILLQALKGEAQPELANVPLQLIIRGSTQAIHS